MKTRSQVMKGLLDRRAPRAEQDLGDNQVWDFLAHQAREGHQELRAALVRGASRAWRVRKVILNVLCYRMAREIAEAEVILSSGQVILAMAEPLNNIPASCYSNLECYLTNKSTTAPSVFKTNSENTKMSLLLYLSGIPKLPFIHFSVPTRAICIKFTYIFEISACLQSFETVRCILI